MSHSLIEDSLDLLYLDLPLFRIFLDFLRKCCVHYFHDFRILCNLRNFSLIYFRIRLGYLLWVQICMFSRIPKRTKLSRKVILWSIILNISWKSIFAVKSFLRISREFNVSLKTCLLV